MNLAAICADHPADAPAIISRGATTTYGQLRDQVGRLRGGLVDQGIQPGDRVAIVAANNWYFVASYLAILGVGAVAVPLNPSSPGPELAQQLAAVEATAVVVGPTGRRAFDSVDRSQIPSVRLVVLAAGDAGATAGVVSLEDLAGAEPVPIVERVDDDLAVLMFTSGVAGYPKAAMLTHGNLRSNLEQIQAQPFRSQTADDVALGVLPFFHIYGLNVVLGLTLYAGGRVITIERFDPASALDSVVDHGITLIAGAPAMWTAWALLPGASPDAFASVRVAGSGAAKLDPAVQDTLVERFGLEVSEGYGLTEASPVVTNSTGIPAPRGSIGAPLPGLRLRLIDADGHDVLVGDAGEIRVQGPNVFSGYWNDEEATAAALTDDGWLRTGDLAVVDDEGFLFLVDRIKDLIIVSGFNVYPAEVEAVLAEHPAVESAAVVGVPHPHSGEAVKAFVVARPGMSVEEDDVIQFCEARIARYKCPQKVVFVDDIPRGLGGKVLKRALR